MPTGYYRADLDALKEWAGEVRDLGINLHVGGSRSSRNDQHGQFRAERKITCWYRTLGEPLHTRGSQRRESG